MNTACRFGTPALLVGFDKPGPDELGCNIHESMVGYIDMVDTPYFAKTRPAIPEAGGRRSRERVVPAGVVYAAKSVTGQ